MFPPEDTLLARGKYATLSKERRLQLERVQGICTTIVTKAHAALRDCELKPPVNLEPLETIEKCLSHLKDARARLESLSAHMNELKPVAWPD